MKIYILIICIALLLLPAVSAADFTTTFNRNYTLSVNVDVNGIASTNSSTDCNATVKNSLGNYIKFQDPMNILDNGDAQITLNATSLQEIGEYPFKISCISGGANKTVSGILQTTSDGEDDNNNIFLVLILGGGAFLILGFGMSSENYIFGFISGILFFLTSIYIFSNGLLSYNNIYTQGVAGVMLVMGVWCNIGAGYTAIEESGVRFS